MTKSSLRSKIAIGAFALATHAGVQFSQNDPDAVQNALEQMGYSEVQVNKMPALIIRPSHTGNMVQATSPDGDDVSGIVSRSIWRDDYNTDALEKQYDVQP